MDSGNVYDRIFRENAQSIFIPLIQSELGIEIRDYEPLESKISKTLEREVDFLYKITSRTGKETILHIEFQTQNNSEMLARMQEYHGLIYRKHKLSIRHIVIFLGIGKSKMKSTLESALIFTGFDTINLSDLDAQYLLSTQVPEMIIMALLGNIKEERIETILRLITERLQQVSNSEEKTRRYLNQLLILSRIRNLEEQTSKYLQDMPITYDINKDSLYLQGMEKGMEKGEEIKEKQFIIKLYLSGMRVSEIVSVLDLEMKKVEQAIKDWEILNPKGNS